MPAGAASITSSSRQRKLRESYAAGRGPVRHGSIKAGPGRGLDGRGLVRDPHYSSTRSMMGGSNRNLMSSGSQRNLMRPAPTNSVIRGNLAESMPTLNEREKGMRESTSSSVDLGDSVRTNPELYLTNDYIEPTTLRRTSTPQHIDELDGSLRIEDLEKFKRKKSSSFQNNHKRNASSSVAKLRSGESFDENNDAQPTNHNRQLDEAVDEADDWWPSWMDPLCNVRKFTGHVVNDTRVQNVVLLMIMINAVMMGIATFPAVKTNEELMHQFELADQIFLIIFTIESSMQLIYHGWKLFKDGFLVFDLLIVVTSWALTGAQVFRAFRIFRAMRLITRVDTLKNLILALFSVVPKMGAICMLLGLIFYIFSVMFTQLFKDLYPEGKVEEPYFSTLYDSLFTLFQMMTLDEWAEILYQILDYHPWAWLPFLVFIIITGFVVVNLMIAVICDAVHVLGKNAKEGLVGSDTSSYPDYEPPSDDIAASRKSSDMLLPPSITQQRLEDLQLQLDDMVIMQEHMQKTIELLIGKLRESAAREAQSNATREAESIEVSIEEKPKGGERVSLSRAASEPDRPLIRTFVSERNFMCHSVQFDESCEKLNLKSDDKGDEKEVTRTRSVSFDKQIRTFPAEFNDPGTPSLDPDKRTSTM